MKKLLLILLCLPMIGFGQTLNEYLSKVESLKMQQIITQAPLELTLMIIGYIIPEGLYMLTWETTMMQQLITQELLEQVMMMWVLLCGHIIAEGVQKEKQDFLIAVIIKKLVTQGLIYLQMMRFKNMVINVRNVGDYPLAQQINKQLRLKTES